MSLSQISAFERFFDRSVTSLLLVLGVVLAGATSFPGVL
jgi:hypothetical protein